MEISKKYWIFLTGVVLIFTCDINFGSAYPYHRSAQQSRNRISANSASKTAKCTTNDNFQGPLGASGFSSRNADIHIKRRWTKFHILPDTTYDGQELETIQKAVTTLASHIPKSCLEIRLLHPQVRPTGDYVKLFKGKKDECSSSVGNWGGEQRINLGSNCITVNSITHELLHALGFHHEHNRHDRDEHITIFKDNIQTGYTDLFIKWKGTTSFGVPYNPNSIMHYHSFDFAKSFSQPSMLTKNGTQIWGRNAGLQETDIAKLKAMYNCSSKATQSRNQDIYDYEPEDWAVEELTPVYSEHQLTSDQERGGNEPEGYYQQQEEFDTQFDVDENDIYGNRENVFEQEPQLFQTHQTYNGDYDPNLDAGIDQRYYNGQQYEPNSIRNQDEQMGDYYDISQNGEYAQEEISGGLYEERQQGIPSIEARSASKTPKCTTIDSIGGPRGASQTLSRNAETNTRRRWTKFHVVPIDYDSFGHVGIETIHKAVTTLASHIPKSCLEIRLLHHQVRPDYDHVRIVKVKEGVGCDSFVGRIGGGQQVRLEPGCVNVNAITHELLHALGLYHEHNRHDRDEHITVFKDNLQDGCAGLYKKLTGTTSFDIPYNINSLMHYSSYACAKSRSQPAMLTKNGTEIVGVGAGLQQSDIDKIKALYNCSSTATKRQNQDIYEDEEPEDWAVEEPTPHYNPDQFSSDLVERNGNGLGDYYDQGANEEPIHTQFDVDDTGLYGSRNNGLEHQNPVTHNGQLGSDLEPDLGQHNNWEQHELYNERNQNVQGNYDDVDRNGEYMPEENFGEIYEEGQHLGSSYRNPIYPYDTNNNNEAVVSHHQGSYSRGFNDDTLDHHIDDGIGEQGYPGDNMAQDHYSHAGDYFRGQIDDDNNMDNAAFPEYDAAGGVDNNFEYGRSSDTFDNNGQYFSTNNDGMGSNAVDFLQPWQPVYDDES